jgi:phosphoserine aminotransferase
MPLKVLETAGSEITNYKNRGMSVMEMSHRQPMYEEIIAEAQAFLREIMQIPDNYKVLFLQGGASMQFAGVCMNLMSGSRKADYIITGQFSQSAFDEAKKYGDIKVAASSKDDNFRYVPEVTAGDIRPDADFVHICENNTVYGTRFIKQPETGGVTLVSDMSSYILSEPFDINKYGLVYAGAQKNMGPSGVTVVIVRDDLIGRAHPDTPKVYDYKIQAETDSMINTPPCYAVYLAGLVFKWIKEDIGGLEAMQKINIEKAKILYDCIDNSKLYKGHANPEYRSMMNVTFVTGSEELDNKFVKEAKAKHNMTNLKGHRDVGGLRASIYNACPIEWIEALTAFMSEFMKENK